MPRNWGNILAYTSWGVAGALALLNLILMVVELTGDNNYVDFVGGSAAVVFRSFGDIIWQSAIFGVAGAVFFALRKDE